MNNDREKIYINKKRHECTNSQKVFVINGFSSAVSQIGLRVELSNTIRVSSRWLAVGKLPIFLNKRGYNCIEEAFIFLTWKSPFKRLSEPD